MKHINTGKVELIAFKALNNVKCKSLYIDHDDKSEILMFDEDKGDIYVVSSLLGKWKVLGDPFKFTEEQWKEIIPCELIGTIEPYNLYWLYPDYERSNLDGFETAICSGYSLLRANKIYRENPYGNGESGHNAVYRDWAETQPHVGNWIVLIKVKEE